MEPSTEKTSANALNPRYGPPICPWQLNTIDQPAQAFLDGYDESVALVVGAGITGLNTGLLLQKSGKIAL